MFVFEQKTIFPISTLSNGFTLQISEKVSLPWPVAYFIMHKWLQNFAFRTRIGLEVFFLSAIIALIISIFTISFHTLKAARANPVDSLRYE